MASLLFLVLILAVLYISGLINGDGDYGDDDDDDEGGDGDDDAFT